MIIYGQTKMKLPIQVAPVLRPDIIQTHLTVNFQDASRERRQYLQADLENGANYNDPMRFLARDALCRCHIFSGYSQKICLATCRYF
jgi:cyanobactin biosynthesis protein (PatB/AcyB/McaB family)